LAGEGPEADALATQARLALKGAAERAAALGSYDQAISLLMEAVKITADLEERGDLLDRASSMGMDTGNADLTVAIAQQALAARRELGDPAKIMEATSNLARAENLGRGDSQGAWNRLKSVIDEFPDLLETPAGIRLMVSFSGVSGTLGRDDERIAWADRALPLAEKLDNPNLIASALISRAVALTNLGRATEGMILLRGGHEMAQAHGLREREINARVLRTFIEQWGEPSVGLALTHEGLELARSYGSTGYWLGLVGNGAVCAFRVGEWDWIMSITDEALPRAESDPTHRLEFMIDRILVRAGRGDDVAQQIDEAEGLFRLLHITDLQFQSYVDWARASAALADGDLAEAARRAIKAAEVTIFFNPLSTPIAARAALWASDLAGAGAALEALEERRYRGKAVSLDKATVRAGIAALEGRTADALAAYREVLRGWHSIGCGLGRGAGGHRHGHAACAHGRGVTCRDRLGARDARTPRRETVPRSVGCSRRRWPRREGRAELQVGTCGRGRRARLSRCASTLSLVTSYVPTSRRSSTPPTLNSGWVGEWPERSSAQPVRRSSRRRWPRVQSTLVSSVITSAGELAPPIRWVVHAATMGPDLRDIGGLHPLGDGERAGCGRARWRHVGGVSFARHWGRRLPARSGGADHD